MPQFLRPIANGHISFSVQLLHKASYIKAKQQYQALLPIYEQESAAYDAQIAKLDATKGGLVARMAADIAKSDLESTIGAKVFDKAKRLNDLQTTMKSHVTQDLEQQINQTTDKLAVNEVAKQHLQRANGEHVGIKDYTGAAGVLFGSMTRHATTYLNGLAARHQDALHIAAAGGMMAAPLAAVLGAGTYSTLSIDAVEKSALAGLDLALDRLGVDKYSRGDISKGLYEVGKLGASGGVVKHGQMFSRQAANLGRSGLQTGRVYFSELKSAPPLFASYGGGNLGAAAGYASKQLPVKHNFINESKLLEHFEKHGGEFKGAYKTPEEYLQGANFVIEHGHKVKYEYMGKERIGYVRFMGNAHNLSVEEAIKNFSKREIRLSEHHKWGEAKFEFLALRDDGAIATYHIKGAEKFYHTLNQNSKNSTVNVEHLSCRMM